jgi:hypothetical protein
MRIEECGVWRSIADFGLRIWEGEIADLGLKIWD